VWRGHWGLTRDPFAGRDSPYVSLPAHDEALYRLVHSIEQAEPRVVLRAESGLGKTTVLHAAMAATRSPRRRFALIRTPVDRTQFLSLLAAQLGQPCGREPSLHASWNWAARALRVAVLEGFHVVLALDEGADRLDPGIPPDLEALGHLGCGDDVGLTVIRVVGTEAGLHPDPAEAWTLAIGLKRLTRSEVEVYLAAKLAAAGCGEPIFTPRALTRLHARSGGVPRGIERLATLSLMAAAQRGLEVIAPEVVDGVAAELCEPIPGAMIAI
jgi:type II secretory pathway predicted ATPase ExeA